MNILFISAREYTYERNTSIIKALRKFSNVEILSPAKKPRSLILTSLFLWFKFLVKRNKKKYEIIYIGFYGYFLIVLIRFFTKTPIIFDAFLSNFDTLIIDRKIAKDNSLVSKLSKFLDKYACKLSNHVLIDTESNSKYFQSKYNIPSKNITSIPVGCDEDLFFYREHYLPVSTIKTVLFYSTYLPLHGVPIIINAAKLLRHKNVKFLLIGNGQEFKKSVQLINTYELNNIKLKDFVCLGELSKIIKESDICLGGHFGGNEKAKRVIPGKIYQILASGKPLIASDTDANKELLIDRKNALLIPQNDPKSLASAIYELVIDQDLSNYLAKNGRLLFLDRCSNEKISIRLKEIINGISSID